MTAAPDGFSAPDFQSDLDTAAFLASIPNSATCKGLIGESLVDTLIAARLPAATTVQFKTFRDYPMRDIIDLKFATARALCPDMPLRHGLALVGRQLFPNFMSSLLGRMMYGVFGKNLSAVLCLANKS